METKPGMSRVLIGLGSVQLFLEFCLLFLQAFDMLPEEISFSIMLVVSFIKLIPHIEILIPMLGK
jgi:hypothetical protein